MEKELDETPRIDVKKDISIFDKIKKKTASNQEQLGGGGKKMNKGLKLANIRDQQEEQQFSSSKRATSSQLSMKQTLTKVEQPSNANEEINYDDIKKGLLSKNSDSENDVNGFTPPEPTSNLIQDDSKNPKSDFQTGVSHQDDDIGSQDEHYEEEFEEEIEEIIEEIDDEE